MNAQTESQSDSSDQVSLSTLDGTWEKGNRSLNAAATFGLLGIGAVYFTAQSILMIIAVMIDTIISPTPEVAGELGKSISSFMRIYAHSIQIILLITQYLFMLLPTVWLVKRWHTNKVKNYIRFTSTSIWEILLAVIGTIAILPTSIFIANELSSFFPLPEEFRKIGEEIFTAHSVPEFIWLVFVIAITPAVCEESLFRGYAQRTFERTMKWKSVILVGVIFGLYHMQPLGLISLSMLGIYLGYLFYRSQSLLPSMAAHFTNNFIAILLLYKTPKIGGIDLASVEQVPVMWVVMSVILTVVIILGYQKITFNKALIKHTDKTDIH